MENRTNRCIFNNLSSILMSIKNALTHGPNITQVPTDWEYPDFVQNCDMLKN